MATLPQSVDVTVIVNALATVSVIVRLVCALCLSQCDCHCQYQCKPRLSQSHSQSNSQHTHIHRHSVTVSDSVSHPQTQWQTVDTLRVRGDTLTVTQSQTQTQSWQWSVSVTDTVTHDTVWDWVRQSSQCQWEDVPAIKSYGHFSDLVVEIALTLSHRLGNVWVPVNRVKCKWSADWPCPGSAGRTARFDENGVVGEVKRRCSQRAASLTSLLTVG